MADSSIENAVLSKPVGTVTQVESGSGHHLIEVVNESEPLGEAAEAASEPPKPQIINASVLDLAAVLQDSAKVRVFDHNSLDLAAVPTTLRGAETHPWCALD